MIVGVAPAVEVMFLKLVGIWELDEGEYTGSYPMRRSDSAT